MTNSSKISISKANLCIRLFLCLLVFINHGYAQEKNKPKKEIEKAYRHYLNMELDSCEMMIKKINPNPWTLYIQSLLTSSRVFISDDPTYYKAQKFHESDLLNTVGQLLLTEEYANFLRSEIKLQWAILKLKNGDEFSAFWGLKQAYAIAKNNTEKHPNFMPSYKTLGLLHVLYGMFPDKYNWILSIFRIEGNVELGLKELEKIQDSNSFFSLEANLYSALLRTYLLNQAEDAVSIMESVYENNKFLLVSYAYGLILLKAAQSEAAAHVMYDVASNFTEPYKISQFYYLKGEIFLQKDIPDSAIYNYQKFLHIHVGKDLVKDANFKIGICYLLKNQADKANNYFYKAEVGGQSKNEADKYAAMVLDRKLKFDNALLRLRYASDGGYYEKALKIHDEIDTTMFKNHDLSEYFYRSARLFHKMNNLKNAEDYYLYTIDNQEEKDWYFAPNAALQLALIYKSQNRPDEAFKALNVIANYDGYPYQNSIRQKAKTLKKSLD